MPQLEKLSTGSSLNSELYRFSMAAYERQKHINYNFVYMVVIISLT